MHCLTLWLARPSLCGSRTRMVARQRLWYASCATGFKAQGRLTQLPSRLLVYTQVVEYATWSQFIV